MASIQCPPIKDCQLCRYKILTILSLVSELLSLVCLLFITIKCTSFARPFLANRPNGYTCPKKKRVHSLTHAVIPLLHKPRFSKQLLFFQMKPLSSPAHKYIISAQIKEQQSICHTTLDGRLIYDTRLAYCFSFNLEEVFLGGLFLLINLLRKNEKVIKQNYCSLYILKVIDDVQRRSFHSS